MPEAGPRAEWVEQVASTVAPRLRVHRPAPSGDGSTTNGAILEAPDRYTRAMLGAVARIQYEPRLQLRLALFAFAALGVGLAALLPVEPATPHHDAELTLEYFVENENIDEEDAYQPFLGTREEIEACYRAALPPAVDWHKDQGRLHVAVRVGDDGYANEVRVRGGPKTLDVYQPCFEAALKGLWFGSPTGRPAGFLGVYKLELGEGIPRRRRPDPAPAARVYPRVIGHWDSTEAIGYLFALLRLHDVERCYDEFLERRGTSGTVDLILSPAKDGTVDVRTRTSIRRLRSVAKCIQARAKMWDVPTSLVREGHAFEVDYDLFATAPPRTNASDD